VFPLDFKSYLKLNRNIAKALFGHLTLWFYASRGQAVEKKYTDLCQILHIRAYPHLSKARSVLEPSLDELMEIGYIAEWELAPTADRHDFKLILLPGVNLLSLPHFTTAIQAGRRTALESSAPPWVAELVQRGVSERRARQLVLDVPQSQRVVDQIEYMDFLVAQDRRGRGRITNPAGLYIWAIEENLPVPDHFETSARRRSRDEANRHQNATLSSAYQLQLDYDQFCLERVRFHMNTHMSGESVEAGIREHLNLLKREQREWFSRVPDAVRREVAITRFEAEVRQKLTLPALEQWTKSKVQAALFDA
jgi:hypothetical protein